LRPGAAVASHPIQLSPDGSPRAVDAEVADRSAGDATTGNLTAAAAAAAAAAAEP
jgi:hypothetical protein